MPSHKGYVYRLKPSPDQLELMAQHFGHVRFVKNWAISLKSRYYKIYGKSLSKRRLQDHLVKKKTKATYQWLNDVNSQSLLAALMDVDNAFKRFFKKEAGYPKALVNTIAGSHSPVRSMLDWKAIKFTFPNLV